MPITWTSVESGQLFQLVNLAKPNYVPFSSTVSPTMSPPRTTVMTFFSSNLLVVVNNATEVILGGLFDGSVFVSLLLINIVKSERSL